MLKPPAPYLLRAMRLSDVPAVMAIEIRAFPVPWNGSSYEYEISENRLAHYQVLLARFGDQPARLVGYAGFWMLAGEAHISTIAVDDSLRGRGLGELLLHNLLLLADKQGAFLATLEVRRSNIAAQRLYAKYCFELVGERRRYYQGKEDALLMTVESFDAEYRSFLRRQKEVLFDQLRKEENAKRKTQGKEA